MDSDVLTCSSIDGWDKRQSDPMVSFQCCVAAPYGGRTEFSVLAELQNIFKGRCRRPNPVVEWRAAKSASQSGGDVRTRTIALTLALCFGGVVACFAQNPFMGTWILNESKSTLTPGTNKNTKVVYEADGTNVKVTSDGTDAAGNPRHWEWTGKFDGKDYPETGDTNVDTRSITRKGSHELDYTAKKGTKVTSSGKVVVSDDGKTRTVTYSATDDQGKKYTNKAVYDKQ